MGDLDIPLWNVRFRLKHHGNTNTSNNISNDKINEPWWIHLINKFLRGKKMTRNYCEAKTIKVLNFVHLTWAIKENGMFGKIFSNFHPQGH
jgi:hypothetical protein